MTATRRTGSAPPSWLGFDLDALSREQMWDVARAMGFLRGWELGKRAGRQDADAEAAQDWAGVAAYVRRTANAPRYSELCERRGRPQEAARARENEQRVMHG